MNGGPRFRGRSEGILGSIGELGGDIASLAELQAQLTLIDTKEVAGRAARPIVVLVAASAVLLATVPVLLIGLAFVLADAMHIGQGAALLITGAVVAATAGALAFLALRTFLHSFEGFRRSREELVRNVNWVRTILAQSARPIHRS